MLQESLILIGFIAVIVTVLIAFAIFLKNKNNKVVEMSFVNLANKILEEKNDTLSKNNFDRLKEPLAPY